MTNPDSQPDFSDPDIINAFFNSHPDFFSPEDNRIGFIADTKEYALQLALREADVFAYLKPWIPGIDETQKLMLSKNVETPTLPDFLADLAISKSAIIEDLEYTEQERDEILEKIDYTIELMTVVSDIGIKMLYPEVEPTVTEIKQFIENGEYLNDTEKIILTNACDTLIKGE